MIKHSMLLLALPLLVATTSLAEERRVTSTAELAAAMAEANPGDVILLASGEYLVDGVLRATRPGAPGLPVTLRAERPGCARLRVDTVEAFKISAPHWVFEDLVMEGVCAEDSGCEHALHVVGAADFFVMRRNVLRDFNAHLKANGEGGLFPDDVLVEDNHLYNTRARETANPVTPIDVVGGRRWLVRRNLIHDFQKALGNQISYGAFLKGNGREGVFEQNVIACALDVPEGGTRIGLSFGGGGTGPESICEEFTCTPEHQDGVMRNNLIVNCSSLGIYLNEAASTEVQYNTLYDTTGIDVRFPESVADLRNNLLTARIRTRDGATMTTGSNLTETGNAAFEEWFADPARYDFALIGDGSSFVDQAEVIASVVDDFCARARGDEPDIGALEYGDDACDTTSRLPLLRIPPEGPPQGPGGTLRVTKNAEGRDAILAWSAGPDLSWNVYRDVTPAGAGETMRAGFVGASSFVDEDALVSGASFYAYLVRAVNPCSGAESP